MFVKTNMYIYFLAFPEVKLFFSGQRYFVVNPLTMQAFAGSIHEYGFPSSIKQVDAAFYISEYGKTVFFVGNTYYR